MPQFSSGRVKTRKQLVFNGFPREKFRAKIFTARNQGTKLVFFDHFVK